MSFFITLVELTDASRRELETIPKVHAMMHHGLTLREYQAFLGDLYHVVWNFCPLMAAAAARCSDRFAHIRYDLYRRIHEEQRHEEWVLEDLGAVGGDTRAAREASPSAPAQAMIGFNYYAVERVHPLSVLGMLYALEVIASVYGGRVSDAIARALGRDVRAGGFKFLSSHATLDLDHLAELNVLVKTIEDPVAQTAIVAATRVNFHQFGALFREGGPLAGAA